MVIDNSLNGSRRSARSVRSFVVNLSILAALLAGSAFAQPAAYQIDGTTGAPLGGIGAGAVKFCAHNGTFAGTWRTPCALDDFSLLPSTQFQMFTQLGSAVPVTNTKLSAVITGGRADDDAVYPYQTANFGTINGVKVDLKACSPWDISNVELMCYPYAFFQIQVKNTNAQSATVAVAFQATLTAATTYVAGKGMKNDDGTFKRAIYASSDDPAAVISAGNDNGFMTSGACNNQPSGAINKVAVKVSLAANETKLIKFVYAWNNDVKGFEGQKDGMFYYLGVGKFPGAVGAGPVADTGLAHFDQFRDNAATLVSRIRKSNFPDWLKNQTMVTLCNLTNNSMYRQDGRYAHTEGQWSTNGTMDQMFHARQIYTMLVPSMNWKELEYWARTQKTNPLGQIHHDIDSCQDDEDMAMSRNMAYMCPWDAQQHRDYRAIDLWVDLNAVYIMSVYECFIATADTSKLSYFWPSVKKAGQRMVDQLTSYNRGSEGYPYLYSSGTQNTYDADGSSDMSAYNNSIAIPTFKILSLLATIKSDATVKTQFDKYYDSMKIEFPKYYFNALHFPQQRTENVMTGPWLGFYYKFGELTDSASLMYAMGQLNSQYNPVTSGLGYPAGTYSQWSEYLVAHYGGTCLQIGKYAEWQGLQYDWYQRIFGNRNLVYNTELGVTPKVTTPTYLATSWKGFDQYISAPVAWRNYYTMVGYYRNKYSQELWVEPCIPTTFTEMNHLMTDAVVFSPEGPVTLSYKESGSTFKVQDIMIKPDNPLEVTSLYVKDKGLATNYVTINGARVETSKITKVGSGFARELKIDYQGTIPSTGMTITVSDDPNFSSFFSSIRPFEKRMAGANMPVLGMTKSTFSIKTVAGRAYDIKISGLDGKILKHCQGFGAADFKFGTSDRNNETALGAAGVYVVRVASGENVVSKCFVLSK